MYNLTKLKFNHRFRYGCFQIVDKIFGRTKGVALTRKYRVKLYQQIHDDLKKKGKGKRVDIKRVKDISVEEFKKKYIRKGIPVVIENGAKDWGCVKNWSLDYFKKLHGEDEVTIMASAIGEKPFEISTLKDILDNISNGGDKYFRFYPLLKEHPEHLKDFDYKWLQNCRDKFGFWDQFQVFIGGKETYTPIHSAMPSNIFTQVYGEKEWVIYPPSLTAIIDCEPGKNFHRGAPHKKATGPFNPFKPDFEPPYNLYQYIDAINVVLKPGDILYNPPQWWHSVENKSVSIGVGFRWISPFSALRSSFFYSMLDYIDAPFRKEITKNFKSDYLRVHLKEMGVLEEYEQKKKSIDAGK